MDNLVSEIVEVCKLPFSEVMNNFKIVQIDSRVIYVSNYLKLLDYSLNKVVLKVKHNTLQITGEEMKISLINKKEIIIFGKIQSFGLGEKNEK